MSISCINCHSLPRTDSSYSLNQRFIDDSVTNESGVANMAKAVLSHKAFVERSWSGNLMPPPNNKGSKLSDDKSHSKKATVAHHRRHETIGAVPYHDMDDLTHTPKLVRSGGIRRDWSFENLAAQQREAAMRRR